ncbi:MAG: Rpn family recombination-promoting nuclease/putative transposase [Planctomycetaceae bacterium]|jgi:predicted transposase/invertase (TIGR01784 family)|nr:Rpn family recombination-promoting nuclease/putative transposase [Planctomycetaceae bacterium]
MNDQEFPSIKPTSNVFIATFLSAPKNESLLCSIINAVLKDKSNLEPIEKATVLNPFNITDFVDYKHVFLDVRVRDQLGREFNIEIQTYNHLAFRERILFGWSRSYSSKLTTGEDYWELDPVITIAITEFAVLPKSKKLHLVFRLHEDDDPTLVLSEHCQFHIWQLHEVIKEHNEVLQDVSPDLAHWSQFFAYGNKKSEVEMSALTENDPQIKKALLEFQRFNSDPETREIARRYQMYEIDRQLSLRAAQKKGKVEGKAEGIVEGKAEGIVEGFAKGKAETEAKWQADKIETARQLILLGLGNKQIAKATGLSIDDIEQLN